MKLVNKKFGRGFGLFITVTLLGLAIAGCSGTGEPARPDEPATPQDPDEPVGVDPREEVIVYFVDASENMIAHTRQIDGEALDAEGRLRKAVQILLDGPTGEEELSGVSSAAKDAAELIGVQVERPYAILDFTARLNEMGGSARVDAFLRQMAYTASEIEGVKAVILKVDGQVVGSQEAPFTGQGFLFDSVSRPLEREWLAQLSPEEVLDLFIAVIPEADLMWELMGPRARQTYGEPGNIDYSAFAEGLGSWRGYELIETEIEGDTARVTIGGSRIVEGMVDDTPYTATMIRVDGEWKWDFPG